MPSNWMCFIPPRFLSVSASRRSSSVLIPVIASILLMCGRAIADSPSKSADGHPPAFSLPLNGYYRVGRYMPVGFPPSQDEFRVSIDGKIETIVNDPAGGIAPCAVCRTPSSDSNLFASLHELRSDEKLIGLATGDMPAQFFVGSKIIPITLDPARPLPGAPSAWQTLDAVFLDTTAAANLGDDRINTLLSGGTSLFVHASTQQPPESTWPWRLDRGYWILRGARPLLAELDDDNFAPLSVLSPGRSAQDRAQVFWLAGIWSVVVLLIMVSPLCKGRAAPIAVCAMAGLAFTSINLLDQIQLPTQSAMGFVHSAEDPAFKDMWIFNRALKNCSTTSDFDRLAIAILPRNGGPSNIKLICTRTGNPVEFRYDLSADQASAFVYRTIIREPLRSQPIGRFDSPLRRLPPAIYPGSTIIGELAQLPTTEWTQWPTLVLANSDPIPKNLTPPSTRDSSNK